MRREEEEEEEEEEHRKKRTRQMTNTTGFETELLFYISESMRLRHFWQFFASLSPMRCWTAFFAKQQFTNNLKPNHS